MNEPEGMPWLVRAAVNVRQGLIGVLYIMCKDGRSSYLTCVVSCIIEAFQQAYLGHSSLTALWIHSRCIRTCLSTHCKDMVPLEFKQRVTAVATSKGIRLRQLSLKTPATWTHAHICCCKHAHIRCCVPLTISTHISDISSP